MKISAIILTGGKINKKLLSKSLDSVKWCDEIVKVEPKNSNGNYSDWRNEGAKMAKGEWILYVDSDEEVSPELANEIQKLINEHTKKYIAYAIPRRNFIFGKEFKHGGQWPDYQKRLFLKNKFKKWTGDVHEEPIFQGELGHLTNPIIHHKDLTISEMIDKTNIWSEIEADLLFKAGHPKMNFFRFASVAFREFWLRMIIQMGFLDGKEGVIYSIYQVYSRLITYSKLWEKQL